MDFDQYANEKAMSGEIAETWLFAFKNNFLEPRHNKLAEQKILDYGFGDGRYFAYFKDNFSEKNIFGVEVSQVRLERAKKLGWENTFLIASEDCLLPFEDEFFDFINMVEVIEHIPKSRRDASFKEISRVLKKDGILILTTPNYPIKRFYDIIGAIYKQKWNRIKDDPTHYARYSFRSLQKFLEKYFSKISIYPYKIGFLQGYIKSNFFQHKILAVCQK